MGVGVEDIERAAAGLVGVTVRTPVVTDDELDRRTGASVHAKAECLQRGGSFKLRGAYTNMAAIPEAERRGGVLAVSSGNHAIAVAIAARILGTRATILVPEDAPAFKIDRVRALGAEVVTFDRYAVDRDEHTAVLREERSLPLVHPYDDDATIAGQGTAGLELLDDVPDLDVLIVPVSGGGLVAGCAIAATARRPGIRIVGVEPDVMDDTRRSLAAGERVAVPVQRTIADGLTVSTPGTRTWAINQRLLSEVVTVDDGEIVDAMAFAFDHLKLVVEPSGAVGLAAVLTGRIPVAGRRVGVVVSGGNVGVDRFVSLMGRARSSPASG